MDIMLYFSNIKLKRGVMIAPPSGKGVRVLLMRQILLQSTLYPQLSQVTESLNNGLLSVIYFIRTLFVLNILLLIYPDQTNQIIHK